MQHKNIVQQQHQCAPAYGHIPALKKHVYPLWISVATLGVVLASLCVLFHFLLYELPHHRVLNKQIITAEDYFTQKNYYQALVHYLHLVDQYSTFKKGHTRVIQSCFALSSSNERFYTFGLYWLSKQQYTYEELFKFFYSFLSPEYQRDFKALLTESAQS